MIDFDYRSKSIEQLKINITKVISDIDSEDMKTKISRWADKFGYSYE